MRDKVCTLLNLHPRGFLKIINPLERVLRVGISVLHMRELSTGKSSELPSSHRLEETELRLKGRWPGSRASPLSLCRSGLRHFYTMLLLPNILCCVLLSACNCCHRHFPVIFVITVSGGRMEEGGAGQLWSTCLGGMERVAVPVWGQEKSVCM